MQIYAALAIILIIPVAFLILRQLPRAASNLGGRHEPAAAAAVFGLRPHTAFALLCLASFLCCVPMAMPQGHLVAFCNDLGIPVARGSAMLSVMLAFGFMGRQLWGFVADRIGGLRTVLAGSACQIVTLTGFLLTQDEAGLFVVAATFGLGFSGIIPAYVLALRELYPSERSIMARAELAAVQRLGNGGGRVACRRDLRLCGLLCRGLCGRDYRKPRQFSHHWRAGFPAEPLLRHCACPLMRARI